MPHPALDAARVARALGLSGPVTLRPLGRAGLHASWLVDPAEALPSLVLRVALADSGWSTFEHERAAVRLAASEGIPVAGSYEVLPHDVLGWPAAVSSAIPGLSGAERPDDPAVVLATGGLAAEIGAIELPSWGTRATDGRFVRARATWQAEWRARADLLVDTAFCAGTWLAPLAARILGRLRDALEALDGCERWALVHGDLRPGNVLFVRTTAGLSPSAVIGWGDAFVGDPLAEWATALELPVPALARYVDGFGVEQVRALLDDAHALARIGVYWRTRCLGRLARAGVAPCPPDRGRTLARALELAHERLGEAEDEHAVRDRLAAALDHDRRPGLRGLPPSPSRLQLRRALEALRHQPPTTVGDAPQLVGALACVELGWAHAEPLIDALGARVTTRRWDPVVDRARWRHDVVARVTTPDGTARLSLVLLHHGLRAAERLGDPADGVLRGLEDLVALQLDHESRTPAPRQARTRLALAVACLHARAYLDLADAGLPDAIRDEIDRLAPDVPTGEARAALLARGSLPPAALDPDDEDDLLFPAVLLALTECAEHLPVDPAAVLVALARTSGK